MGGGVMAVEVHKNYVTVAGLRTYYWQAGNGPVLLMLHGQLPGSGVAVEWGDQVQRFGEAGFSVYAPDVPGFGRTDNPPDYSIDIRVAHARAFADHFSFIRYSIWGSSMGSYMACALALSDQRVHKLILNPSTVLPPQLPGMVAPATPMPGTVAAAIQGLTPSLENARAILKLVLKNPKALTDELVQLFSENWNEKNQSANRGRLALGTPKPLHTELPRLRNPALLLWGAEDRSSVTERAVVMQRLIERSELHVLSACGHWPQVDQRDRSWQVVTQFLQA
jgi:pimeloyl-ACP methyl ester carboxylesterase